MDWMKFRPLYLLVSGVALAFAVYSLVTWHFKLSIDFTGGTDVEYLLGRTVSTDELSAIAKEDGKFDVKEIRELSEKDVQFRFGSDFSQDDAKKLEANLTNKLKLEAQLVRFETVGPTFSQEIFKKTLIAVALASLGILIWIAFQFKNFKFGVFAIAALLHDLTILLGTYAFLGHYKNVEVDILVVTAFLTTLSLSLYDTIVVYDRIRESMKRNSGLPFYTLANNSITETIVRSLNTSLISSFVLVALFLIGGPSIKWFVFALLVGTITGTYSSPFVAVPLVVTWEQFRHRFKKRST